MLPKEMPMYTLTANDKLPRDLFGQTYWWSPNESGALTLVPNAALVAYLESVESDA